MELDTKLVKKQIRLIPLTRKDVHAACNEIGGENWVILASTVATCNLSCVNPVDCLADTLRAILNGHPKSLNKNLMPCRQAQP